MDKEEPQPERIPSSETPDIAEASVRPPDQCWQCDCNDGDNGVYYNESPQHCSCGRSRQVQCP